MNEIENQISNELESEVETESEVFNEQETEKFEISEEVKAQSKKFFNFGSKPKPEKRKFESFEIVKTFVPNKKPKPKAKDGFSDIVDVSNNYQAVEETISVQSESKKQAVKVQMRAKGKFILILVGILILILSGFSIANGVKINNLNNDLNSINQQITIEDANLKKAIKELGALTSEEKIKEESGRLDFIEVPENEVLNIELYERKPVVKPASKTNWFDKVCDLISNIFGG